MEIKDCTCERGTARDEQRIKELTHRLNRIEGQIRGIKGMLEKDAYCMDILVQSAAVASAIRAFNAELLADHINGCVVEGIKEDNLEMVKELVVMIERLIR